MIHYSCIGATGYVCGEVLRMMVNHHEGELVNVLDTYGAGAALQHRVSGGQMHISQHKKIPSRLIV